MPTSLTIGELGLSPQLQRWLAASSIEDVGFLSLFERRDLLRLPNIGAREVDEIEQALGWQGYALAASQL